VEQYEKPKRMAFFCSVPDITRNIEIVRGSVMRLGHTLHSHINLLPFLPDHSRFVIVCQVRGVLERDHLLRVVGETDFWLLEAF
jgi:hypothetical protein